ncbi:MAG: uL15m family ribosomal protein [Candidatus Thalassarchaeaceae archaeon]|jgi:large subunit ribosomal protein L15|nr:uL15m family ribosomal protein [Candidatus Thalassarchaeaceae archaeon]DAC34103.1 MAG TPA: 50S ribosomal protein L15 [Candidatus Poseidoniales archaeon]MDP6317942.1 uL15m family ribosomal protein [Candidatus Thalassarchaeaceae archaeon]HIH80443.1 50S ribosomal protein L15 [Candidatus Thalassarchaeaceae archaeon]HJM29653.1 uL15m family ribosomal protein [Candidatus Thalassarchaeaceae archaeon]|tara:strand:- start:1013 stop:1432 length:420 start_codon:yes stop_codon:yes gene_type:complete
MVSRTNKFRGRSRYHGRGKKAGRGAGLRGGRGNAGINKHRLMTRLKYMPGHWGMHGFNRHPSLRKVNVSINLKEISQTVEGDEVNLGDMGYDKLLGSGRIDRAMKITVASASARAIEKVEAAGGSVILEDGDDEEWEEE